MFEAIDKHGLDIAFCDMIYSYTYGLLRTRPFINYIDMGCFIAKSEAAKSVGFRDKTFSGDARYFEDLVDHFPNICHRQGAQGSYDAQLRSASDQRG